MKFEKLKLNGEWIFNLVDKKTLFKRSLWSKQFRTVYVLYSGHFPNLCFLIWICIGPVLNLFDLRRVGYFLCVAFAISIFSRINNRRRRFAVFFYVKNSLAHTRNFLGFCIRARVLFVSRSHDEYCFHNKQRRVRLIEVTCE